MDVTSKKDLAVSFLGELANMRRDRLQQIVGSVIGEELASVMYNYARQVIEASPEKTVENASSLLILGYLIRVQSSLESTPSGRLSAKKGPFPLSSPCAP
jgi:hypothetical protein